MVISGVNTVTYNGDGITTAWPYTFPVTDDSEIRVQLHNADGTAVIIESDYYVDLVNSTVYYPGYAPGSEPPEADQPPKVQDGQTITVYREIPITQEADLGEKWPFEVIEKGLDKLTMIAQQIDSGTKRTIDNALASMELLADVVVDSGELQHITDQFNAIDDNAEAAADSASVATNAATVATSAASSATSSASAAENFKGLAEASATIAQNAWAAMQNSYGYPFVASLAADMTDTTKIYVYVGSEAGYVNGNWYYYDGAAWVSGGVYNSIAFDTDKTLTVSGAAADAEVVGWINNNFIYNKELTVLPADINGKFSLSADSSNYVVCGTQNVAELLNLHQGTTTINDVTITVSGNTVTMSGTASADVYYSFVDGTSKLISELSSMDLGLPVIDNKYTLSTKTISSAPTTTVPSVCVRSKVSGNVVATQNNTAQFTMNTSTCGGLYMLISNGKTYNLTFVLAIFPYETTNGNVYREETSSVSIYNQSDYYSLQGYTWAVGSPTLTELKTRLPKKPVLVYSSYAEPQQYTGITEQIDIFVPTTSGYVDYVFGHTVSVYTQPQGGGNVWRLVQITKANDGFIREYYITSLGETEMAIKILGRDDFIGGFTHGDEWLDSGSALFLLDGESVTISDYTTLTEFDELQVFATNTMYDPADHTTVVGKHGVSWKFTKDGLEIGQSVNFSADLTLIGSYLGMICAIRNQYSSQTLQITDTYIDDGNFTQYDVSSPGFTGYPRNNKLGIKKAYLIGKTQKLTISAEYTRQVDGLAGAGLNLFNGAAYNKLYNAVCGYNDVQVQIANGTKWQTEMKISIEASV